jgi:hypothetical protein
MNFSSGERVDFAMLVSPVDVFNYTEDLPDFSPARKIN